MDVSKTLTTVKLVMMGIPLTQVTPISSMRRARRISAQSDGFGSKVLHRRGVSGIPWATSVADGFPVSSVRVAEGMAGTGLVGVCEMWISVFRDGWNGLPGHTHSFAGLVSRDVVGDYPKERGECVGAATGAGAEKV